jgi:hypothetical protein
VSAWIFAAFAVILAAQEPASHSPEILLRANLQQRNDWAAAWLQSQDPLRVAWGAWVVRQDRETKLIPLLVQKVVEYQTVESAWNSVERDQHDALLMVLDALIQLRGALPVEQAYKLYPEFAAQSVILLIRSPDDATAELLSIFGKARANWTWLAAGNVLSKAQTAGFAALLLSRFTQHLKVWVVDAGTAGGEGGGGSECGFSLAGPKRGWPRVGLYALTQFPERIPWLEARFLIGGETPVHYLRADPGNYDNPPDNPGYCDDGDRDKYRAQYLVEFPTPAWPKIALKSYPEVTIVWQGGDAYRSEFMRAVEEQRTLFRDAVVAIKDHGLTAEEAASLQPRAELVIRDIRHDKSTPLPVINNDPSMEVVAAFRKPLN